MREIKKKFQKISEQVKGKLDDDSVHAQKGLDRLKKYVGAFSVARGTMAASAAVAGSVVAVGAAAGAAAGGALAGVAAVGGAVVVGTVIAKKVKKKRCTKKVEKLEQKIKEVVGPMEKELEEIQTTCERLKEEFKEFEAEVLDSDTDDVERILSELRTRSEDVTEMASELRHTFMSNNLRITATLKEDRTFTDAIIESTHQCEQVADDFKSTMKKLHKRV